uniref:G-protein coupled receptors family 1 profile domain-containing protein n=2 Tax=Knipowitschia caucasica TaxID=637954 RepID=A0AAV2KUG7_KNICA
MILQDTRGTLCMILQDTRGAAGVGLESNQTQVALESNRSQAVTVALGTGRLLLPVLMFVVGAVGNLVAIVALSVSRREQKSSAFYTLVCGLAVTDLLGTCLASPITIATYLDPDVLQDERLCAFHSFLLLFFSLTGLSVICAMAAERYVAICCAFTYRRCRVGRSFAQRVLCGIYLSHVLLCSLPALGLARSQLQRSATWCFIEWRSWDPVAHAYTVLYGSTSVLLILGTLLLNLAVCGALLLMRRRSATNPLNRRASVRQRWRALSSAAETQMMAVLLTTSAVVLSCSAPLVVRVFVNCFTLVDDPPADLAAIRIASVNPILDPWIYILLRRSLFRRLRSASVRRLSARGSAPHSNLFFPNLIKDGHVITQLLWSANVATQLPTALQTHARRSQRRVTTETHMCSFTNKGGKLDEQIQDVSCKEEEAQKSDTAAVRQ